MFNDLFFPDDTKLNAKETLEGESFGSFSSFDTFVLFMVALVCSWTSPSRGIAKTIHTQDLPIITVNKSTEQLEIADTQRVNLLRERLHSFKKLEAGWDGEGSVAIDKEILQNTDKVLTLFIDRDLPNWSLFPDRRGYVVFNLNDPIVMAGITVTRENIVFFCKERHGKLTKGKKPYQSKLLYDFIRLRNAVA